MTIGLKKKTKFSGEGREERKLIKPFSRDFQGEKPVETTLSNFRPILEQYFVKEVGFQCGVRDQ